MKLNAAESQVSSPNRGLALALATLISSPLSVACYTAHCDSHAAQDTTFSLGPCLSTEVTEAPGRHEHNGMERLRFTLNSASLRGCRFDLMLTSWVPADCVDAEFMESYLAEHT